MAGGTNEKAGGSAGYAGGWAGWLLARWQGRRRAEPRLALVERITLAPRQSLALIEAEGRRILVATSPEGGPAFYPLDERAGPRATVAAHRAPHGRPRVSW
jgi:Flagellar biosynthesis protein, FliO